MNIWIIANLSYGSLALLTLIPFIISILRTIPLLPGGPWIEESDRFSEEAKMRLSQLHQRMLGPLIFWKNQANRYRLAHNYCIGWIIPSSVVIPILAQAIDPDPYSKLLVTIISGHVAVLYAFHKGLKVEQHFQTYRNGESEYFDLNRKLLDTPDEFGENEDQQFKIYARQVERIRMLTRRGEIDAFPTLKDIGT